MALASSMARGPEVTPMIGASGLPQTIKVSGTVFMLPPRYRFIRPIGHGAYGVVVSALDVKSQEKVAIKKIPRAFDDLVDAKRILREVRLLRQFKHENIINILDILPPPSLATFEDVYIVSNLMETDLHRIIYSPQPLSMEHVQYFVYQVLKALKYMHSANVLHRDLKPSNLLLNSNCELKVCDLGLARGISDVPNLDLTEYVVTRWYRAPEIMLACQEYTKAIDVWSVGCIFAELINRLPLFPGEDYINQLQIICEKLGRPREDDLDFVTSLKAKKFIMGLEPTQIREMRQLFPTAGADALDLIGRMLTFNPKKRITVQQALLHPFMASVHSPEEEPVAEGPFSFAFEAEALDRPRLQRLIWDEMLNYHPERAHETHIAQAGGLGGLPVYDIAAANRAAAAATMTKMDAGAVYMMPTAAAIATVKSDPWLGAAAGNIVDMKPADTVVRAEAAAHMFKPEPTAAAAAAAGSPMVLTPASDASGPTNSRPLKRAFSHLGEEYGGESPRCRARALHIPPLPTTMDYQRPFVVRTLG
eukprot:TRINITY_DN1193_c0_g1_i4.p1 TRINITY_DN1193_c0_g1~~TRINITY_DN1193_c0_g1_i4.p1  ORF type:complete len:534 (-),score=158.60 TRINITY_DN1193_c0_g1_i4:858-2459(-)